MGAFMRDKKCAVFLLNLGGPDTLEAVRPFLFNLFSDKAIISLPQPFRSFIAYIIAKQRTPKAQGIYRQMGGASPILPNTQEQAKALEEKLGPSFVVYPVMRYWNPRAHEVIKRLDQDISHVVLMPLYPQYSTTTTESSYLEIRDLLKKNHFKGQVSFRCCYPLNAGWIQALTDLIRNALRSLPAGPYRLLFTAHGLPENVIKKGDPYQFQVESTVKAVVKNLGEVDWKLSYQSRVGPLKWIGPATEDEVVKAGTEGKGLVVVPIAFVSEHSETLVELDKDYRDLAESSHVPFYKRVFTVSTHKAFIEGLRDLVMETMASDKTVSCPVGGCPSQFKKCGARFASFSYE